MKPVSETAYILAVSLSFVNIFSRFVHLDCAVPGRGAVV
jgi:hypothetical protein